MRGETACTLSRRQTRRCLHRTRVSFCAAAGARPNASRRRGGSAIRRRSFAAPPNLGAVLALSALVVLIASSSAGGAFRGRNGLIVYGTGGAFTRLYVVRTDGSGTRLIYRHVCVECRTGLFEGDPTPAVSPDGRRVVFRQRDGLVVVGIDGRGAHRLTPGTGARHSGGPSSIDFAPSWSPDGRQIAYAHGVPQREVALWIMRADGTHRRRVPLPYVPQVFHWSPNGRILVSQAGNFVSISPTGEPPRRLWPLRAVRRPRHDHPFAEETTADWSPDGRRLAVDCAQCSVYYTQALFLVTPGSKTPPVEVTSRKNANVLYRPVWSPDGKELLVLSPTGHGLEIIGLDGEVHARLGNVPSGAGYDWQAIPAP